MGILLKWRIPDTDEVTYDITLIERSTSQTGTYTQIASQSISDNTYFDSDGTTSSWYKVRFRGGTAGSYYYSDYSDTMQGGKFKGYCTPDDVRKVANLSSTDIEDSRLYDIIQYATAQINHEINGKIIEELVTGIDTTRENKVDGNNTTYYVQRSFKWYIGDMDDDGDVDTDDIEVYDYDTNGARIEVTVSSITPNEGKIVLSSAPASGHTLKITYCYAPYSESDPHPMITQACAYLSAGLAFTRIETGYFEKLSLGRLSVANMTSGFQQFHNMYQRIIHMLKSRMVRRTEDKRFWFGKLNGSD